MKPNYQHDCTTCVFLGSMKSNYHYVDKTQFQTVDLYAHDAIEKTVVIRFSSEPSDYGSGLWGVKDEFKSMTNPYAVAVRRALEIGMFKTLDLETAI